MRFFPKLLFVLMPVLSVPVWAANEAKPASAPVAEKMTTDAVRRAASASASLACTNGMQQQVGLNISLNAREDSIQAAQNIINKRMAELEALAKQNNVQKFVLNSMNYNIATQMQYDGGGQPSRVNYYQFSGNINYQMDNAEAATLMMEKLVAQGVQVSMNVNSHRNGNCE